MAQGKSNRSVSGQRTSSRSRRAFDKGQVGVRAKANELLSEITDGRSVMRRNLKEWNAVPLLSLIGGGIVAAYFGRYLFRYYQGHPEISETIRDRLDGVESRLRNFRIRGMRDDAFDIDSRH